MSRELVPSFDQGNLVPVVDQGLDLRVYLNLLRRRYLFLIVPAVVIFAGVCAVTYLVLPVSLRSASQNSGRVATDPD